MSGIFGNNPEDRAMERHLDAHLDSIFKYDDTCIVCRNEPHKEDVAHDVDGWHNVPSDISSPVICKDCASVEEVIEKWELDEL